MTPFMYDPAGYRNLLRMSNRKHLLVEGKDDKRLFKILLDELYDGKHNIDIDAAECLIDTGIPRNGDKVEEVCRSVEGTQLASKLVGFVDREFRDFGIGEALQDHINKHKVSGCLVWSRGHSVENYYFDFRTLRHPLRTFSVTEYFDEALSLFEEVMPATIRLACTISLVGDEALRNDLIKKLMILDDSVSAEFLTINSPNIDLDRTMLKGKMTEEKNVPSELADQVILSLNSWQARVEAADFDVVRWLCRGHTGLSLIWKAYSRCVFSVCQRAGATNPAAEAQKALSAQETHRFNLCTEFWTRKALGSQTDYPLEVLRMLELPEPVFRNELT